MIDEYNKYHHMAIAKSWPMPFYHTNEIDKWIEYWRLMEIHERNPRSKWPAPPPELVPLW